MSDLSKLDRGDLNTVAAALGVSDPAALANKDEVAKVILATAAPQDEALKQRAETAEASAVAAKADLAAAQEETRTTAAQRDDLVKQLGERDATIDGLNEQLAGPKASTEERRIERKTTIGATPGHEDLIRAWWCPFCDTSNGGELTKCSGCGAERDGDTATRRTYEE